MIVLGVWDGHDSGASLIIDGKIVSAVNEERFTRRKQEVRFPYNSIKFCLENSSLRSSDIDEIAFASSDVSNTVSRAFPKVSEDYYYVRRKLKTPSKLSNFNRPILNNLGRIMPNNMFRRVNEYNVRKRLSKLGFDGSQKLHFVEHHIAHAASAFFTSGKKESIVLTYDALGDGISSSVNLCNSNGIQRLASSGTVDSLVLMYQEAVEILKMRILEDEGKVMCLADFSKYNKKNPLRDIYYIDDLKIKSKLSFEGRWKLLNKLAFNLPKEDFCFLIQDAFEYHIEKWISNIIDLQSPVHISLAGGGASNIKANMKIKKLIGDNNWFVFPQMGDGGLALGAALYIYSKHKKIPISELIDVRLGPEYDDSDIKRALLKHKLKLSFDEISDPAGHASDILTKNKIVFWFQNRMEFGPRSLGARSMLAPANLEGVRDKLNSIVKRRSKYQPFCPSILHDYCKKSLIDYKKESPFMTMGYYVKEEYLASLSQVMSKDNSSRPQSVVESYGIYYNLLKNYQKETGIGGVLNTSFNIHGEPIVCSPEDAIRTQINSTNKYMVIGNYLVSLK